MVSFKARMGWKRPRKKKIKIIVSFRSYTTRNRKFQKNSKKIQKAKKHHYGIVSSQNSFQMAKKERK